MKLMNLEEIKLKQIELLNIVADFCIENNIKYYLAYGTLIGAVRHQGYIPWDDDIDIMMLRPDYDKFIHTFNKRDKRYQVHAYELDKSFAFPFSKVSNEKTKLVENTSINYEIGVNIDIFPIDNVPLNDSKTLRKRDFLYKIYTLKIIKFKKNRSMLKNITLFITKLAFSWLKISKVNELMIKNSKRYQFKNTEHVCNLSFLLNEKPVSKSLFDSQVKVKFENREHFTLIGYDEWLTNVYGDYMELPPKEEQITHHDYKAYIR